MGSNRSLTKPSSEHHCHDLLCCPSGAATARDARRLQHQRRLPGITSRVSRPGRLRGPPPLHNTRQRKHVKYLLAVANPINLSWLTRMTPREERLRLTHSGEFSQHRPPLSSLLPSCLVSSRVLSFLARSQPVEAQSRCFLRPCRGC